MDQGGELVSHDMDHWANQRGVTLDFSGPGKLADNADTEAVNGRFRTESLNRHWFPTPADAGDELEAWPRYYDEERPRPLGAIGNMVPMTLTKSRAPPARHPERGGDTPEEWSSFGVRITSAGSGDRGWRKVQWQPRAPIDMVRERPVNVRWNRPSGRPGWCVGRRSGHLVQYKLT